MSKILKLTSENIKRVAFVEITPEGNLVLVTGKNAQGKSSLIDSIEYVLRGVAALPSKPLRKGAEKGSVEIDLGDLVAKRTFTAAGGGALVVKNKEGQKLQKPQEILDSLVGKFGFDPLAFLKQPPKAQAETLRQLLNLDFKALDAEHDKAFQDRAIVNREVVQLKSSLALLPPEAKDVPAEEQSTAAILAEQEKAAAANTANAAARSHAIRLKEAAVRDIASFADAQEGLKDLQEELKRLQEEIKVQEKNVADWKERTTNSSRLAKEASEKAEALKDNDLSGFRQQLADLEQTNMKVRFNKSRAEQAAKLKEKSKAADALTRKLDKIQADKRAAILSAQWPVPGLGMSEAFEVTFNGLPFDQASTSEQLRVSVAIGLAMNPKLRVLLIRAGNDLDSDGLKLVAEMAEKADGQIWLEKISSDGLPCVVLEDGYVKGQGEPLHAEFVPERPDPSKPHPTDASDATEQQEMGITP